MIWLAICLFLTDRTSYLDPFGCLWTEFADMSPAWLRLQGHHESQLYADNTGESWAMAAWDAVVIAKQGFFKIEAGRCIGDPCLHYVTKIYDCHLFRSLRTSDFLWLVDWNQMTPSSMGGILQGMLCWQLLKATWTGAGPFLCWTLQDVGLYNRTLPGQR